MCVGGGRTIDPQPQEEHATNRSRGRAHAQPPSRAVSLPAFPSFLRPALPPTMRGSVSYVCNTDRSFCRSAVHRTFRQLHGFGANGPFAPSLGRAVPQTVRVKSVDFSDTGRWLLPLSGNDDKIMPVSFGSVRLKQARAHETLSPRLTHREHALTISSHPGYLLGRRAVWARSCCSWRAAPASLVSTL